MTDVAGDPFAKKSKVKVNGGTKPAAPAPVSDTSAFLAEYRAALVAGKDLKLYRERAAEMLESKAIDTQTFYKAIHPEDFK